MAAHPGADRRQLTDLFPDAARALRTLVAEGVLEAMSAAALGEPRLSSAPELTGDQRVAIARIGQQPGTTWLLQGVTGSGKTEVYLALIEAAVAAGQQAMVLLPEIALTPQTVGRFRERFGPKVAVWHSALSQGERRATWDSVRRGDTGVVVGARSGVFLPFPQLGVIVVDEEHEPTYKQEEHPRYHTREVALWRGAREGATVVLGSATPSIESRYQVACQAMRQALLPRRVLGRPLPAVALVDMREELKQGNRDIFSQRLKTSLLETFSQGQQSLLFLNRRGYSTFILCRSCGQALGCPDCAVSLTYHQGAQYLSCHYCLRQFPVPSLCPQCHSDKIRYFGAGTERVVEEVQRLLPDARILRADRDTLTRPQQYADLYQAFYRRQADVLVGTQMIAKGMDFPGVTLVGVVAADTALNFPDYRSAERTFQLLVQASGRSGRAAATGQVVIQTYNPDHYAVRLAQTHDYEAFYQAEIAFRREADYPPFAELWLLLFDGKTEREVAERSRSAAECLRQNWPALRVLGPAPAPLARVRGLYRYHVLIKSDSGARDERLAAALKAMQSRDSGLSITRDPYFLL